MHPAAMSGTSQDLTTAVRQADAEHGLLRPGEAVVVGVSGGPDSVALLDVLRGLAPARDVRLHVAHLDHMQRAQSVNDAAFVAQLAKDWGLAVTLEARDVAALAAEAGRGLEDAARTARYAFLASVALRVGASSVAVAHTADDQAETVLLHVVRGAGLDGIRGMAAVARYPLTAAAIASREPTPVVPPDPNGWPPRLVRPMLGAWRSEVAAYLAARGLDARDDASNRDRRFARNRLRLDVLPHLEALNPRVRQALVRAAAAAAGDVAVVEQVVDDAWGNVVVDASAERVRLRKSAWSVLPVAVQRRLLRRAVACLRGGTRDLEWVHVEAVRRLAVAGDVGASLALPGGVRMACDDDSLTFHVGQSGLPPAHLPIDRVPLAVPGETRLPGGWTIVVMVETRGAATVPAPGNRWTAVLDADSSERDLGVRSRRPGDRFQPLGMAGRHKSLQDLFVDARVPRRERDAWPIVVSGSRIVWVPGLRLDQRAAVHPATRRLLVLTARPPERVATA